MRFENTHYQRVVWTGLVNKATGSTLDLEAGEQAEVQQWQDGVLVDLPDDFAGGVLKPVPEGLEQPVTNSEPPEEGDDDA